MTVVVAFVTTNAAVMASDTEGTEADGTKHDVDKIWTCGSLLLGYTGSTVISQPLRAALDQAIPAAEAGGSVSRWAIRQKICETCKTVLAGEYANRVPPVPGEVPRELSGALLAIGRDDDGYWLLEVDRNAGGTFYHEIGFHSVGSGSVSAQTASGLLRNYGAIGRERPHLRLIAYRTVATCIHVLGSNYGVGGEVSIWDAADGEQFEHLDAQSLQRVGNGVEQWITIEAESLDRVVLEEEDAAAAAAEDEAEVELPEELEPAPAEPAPAEGGG
jgi:hypothetical protein